MKFNLNFDPDFCKKNLENFTKMEFENIKTNEMRKHKMKTFKLSLILYKNNVTNNLKMILRFF